MINRKDFIIVVLIGFFLAVTLYPKTTTSVIQYDPWLDYNDDGKVDMRDIGPVARAFGLSGDPTKNVTVTNFPLDEEGNLKTTTVQTTEIRLVFNESLTVGADPNNYVYLTSFNTSGFKYAYIMAKAELNPPQERFVGANIYIWFFENNLGIKTLPVGMGGTPLNTDSQMSRPDWGAGASGTYEIHSTSTDLYLQYYNSAYTFEGLLTIVVFLSNYSFLS